MMNQYADRAKLEEFLFNNPQIAAALGKSASIGHRQGGLGGAMAYARSHSEQMAENVDINSEFSKLFFDLDVAVEILIGLILSPSGAAEPELIYGSSYKALPPSVIGNVTKDLATYLNDTYHLKTGLAKLLRAVMYEKGSVCRIIIPESVIDSIVRAGETMTGEALSLMNGTTVSLKGIMRTNSPSYYSTEGRGFITRETSPTLMPYNLTITDNFDLLAVPKARAYHNKQQIKAIISPLEASIESSWMSEMNEYLDLSRVSTTRNSIGLPLYMEVDSAAVTPIPLPGDSSQHTGYLLLLDDNGFPVSPKNLRREIMDMYKQLPTTPMGKSIVDNSPPPVIVSGQKLDFSTDKLISLFMSQVNNEIERMLSNGGQVRDLSTVKVNSLYAAALARAMSGQRTRLLFLPPEMVVYYAFKHDDNGVGVTLLNDLPTLSSMRASLLFSGLVREIKNNIPQTKVNVRLDENDVDPDSTLEMIHSNVLERQANLSPLGLTSITDWTNWAYRAGVSFQIEEHPDMPNTKIDYEDVSVTGAVASESALHEKLRAQQIMAIGVTPEMVDSGFASDFATSDQAKRVQLIRRVTARKIEFTAQLTSEVRKLAKSDANIYNGIKQALESITDLTTHLSDDYKVMYKKDRDLTISKLSYEIADSIVVSLPNIDVKNIRDTVENLQIYSDGLDLAIKHWLSAESIQPTEDSQLLLDNIEVLTSAIKAHFMREYMIENGYFSQLSDIVNFTDDGGPKLDLEAIMTGHLKGTLKMAGNYLKAKAVEDVPVEEVVPVEEDVEEAPVEDDSVEVKTSPTEEAPVADDVVKATSTSVVVKTVK